MYYINMRLKPLQRRTEEEQFSRYIRTEFSKVLLQVYIIFKLKFYL